MSDPQAEITRLTQALAAAQERNDLHLRSYHELACAHDIAEKQRDTALAELAVAREALADARKAQASTAENPNESAYERGRFDGVMDQLRMTRNIVDTALSPSPRADALLRVVEAAVELREYDGAFIPMTPHLTEQANGVWNKFIEALAAYDAAVKA